MQQIIESAYLNGAVCRNFLKQDLGNHGKVPEFDVWASVGTPWLVERLYSFILHSFSVTVENRSVCITNAGYSRSV